MAQGDGGSRIDAAGVDAAIAQVLQAERAAREDVQRCAAEAEAIVERAHERARQISRCAAHRSVRVQRWLAERLQHALDGLAEQRKGIERVAAPDEAPRQLSHAVATLASRLTGGGP